LNLTCFEKLFLILNSNIFVLAIIPSFNGEKLIGACIKSIEKSSFSTDILVVDNASEDKTVKIINLTSDTALIIQNQTNVGFGTAINQGLDYGLKKKYTHFLILNQDTEIHEFMINKLLGFASTLSSKSWSLISPVNLNSEGNQMETYFQDNLVKRSGNYPVQTIEGFKIQAVDFINAACWLINAESLSHLKGFDQRFFVYGEDLNFCHRSKFHHLNMFVLHDTHCIHHKIPGDYELNPKKLLALKTSEMLAYYLNPSISFFHKTKRFVKINMVAIKLGFIGRFKESFEKFQINYSSIFKVFK